MGTFPKYALLSAYSGSGADFGHMGAGGVAFKDFLGTTRYSVGDPPATRACGLGLSPKYSFFMSSPALWPRGGRFFRKKRGFLGVTKGVFGLKMLFLH